METKSIWLNNFDKVTCPKLDKNIETDVLIIGGGMTGISTAYHLINQNLKVCVAEKNIIGNGVTARTTGKLTFLQENLCSKIKLYCGKNKAKDYLESQIEAINIVREIIEKENIICNLEKVDSYIFSNEHVDKLLKEKELITSLGIDVISSNKLPIKDNINCFYAHDTYVFHPLKYLNKLKDICLSNGVDIYEETEIFSIEKENDYYICKTDKNKIICKYVVLALHYPYFLKPFWLPFKTYIEKSYIEAFKVDKNYKFSAITISKPVISIRYYSDSNKHYQLYLNNSHNLCIKEDERKNFSELLNSKNIHPSFLWSNNDIMTSDSLPYIGTIDNDNTFLIGTGYNTWGMTNGSIAGKVLSDIILNKENKYIELFNPKRGINLGKIINFPLILGSNSYSFIKSKLSKNKKWYSSKVRFEKRDGNSVAIYIDDNKKEHIVYNRCPHLKCSLIFNEIEKTWDCPCHGSRFDINGNVIEGPSNYNITYKKE